MTTTSTYASIMLRLQNESEKRYPDTNNDSDAGQLKQGFVNGMRKIFIEGAGFGLQKGFEAARETYTTKDYDALNEKRHEYHHYKYPTFEDLLK